MFGTVSPHWKKRNAPAWLGWVRNLSDGSVEVMLQGEEKAVRHVEAWLSQGPELANVAEVKSEEVAVSDELVDFRVI